ncbi:alanine acetyltransferase [Azorhizobium oxalatiphilum]|uniref:Alanine acetyltransferase n=1 Tax=Azorhizobium oxalatiphilum TaxID=980631 RepID=A0A917CAN5_9HYPH|nr:GNAT family N-acetyltransferase [Azorhizobium oxalatiphilum]GGF79852.1 alanine acetyltransferase [Azorhizobium oxalatiphilum]
MSTFSRFFSSPEPDIRDAVTADAPELARLHATAFHRGWSASEFERLLAERTGVGHVMRAGPRGKLLGFVLSHAVPPESEILSIVTEAASRGQGLARRLLTHHLGRLAAQGVTASFLEVEAGNDPAIALYRRAGYAEAGRRKGYYEGPSGRTDALVMRRDF